MDLGIAGKRALVAGASKGLGFGCAKALAEAGVDLVLNARNDEALMQSADQLRKCGVAVLPIAGDITTEAGREKVLSSAGAIDILVTNAGGPPPGFWNEWDRAALLSAIEANLVAPIALMQAYLPSMMEKGWGRVINITSSV